jgi:hypothetical protein
MRGSLIVSVALMAIAGCVYAQTSPEPGTPQVTRAEVLHELQELESVGYNPSMINDPYYPTDIQAAEQKLQAKHQAKKNALLGGNQTAQTKPTP